MIYRFNPDRADLQSGPQQLETRQIRKAKEINLCEHGLQIRAIGQVNC